MVESNKPKSTKVRNNKCHVCVSDEAEISYKDISKLKRYLNEREMIVPRQKSRLCAYHQRKLSNVLKKARFLSLLSVGGKRSL